MKIVLKNFISLQPINKSSVFAIILLYGASTLLKSYFKNSNMLAVMRVCVIKITGSRRPHKADSVNPRFL